MVVGEDGEPTDIGEGTVSSIEKLGSEESARQLRRGILSTPAVRRLGEVHEDMCD